MAKRTKKRVRNAKDQSGCMWGLINIFDFRHGRPSQKLIEDRKRGSRRIAGAALPSDEINTAEDSCEICKNVDAGEQCHTSMLDKLSVKALMEEEMFEQHVHSVLDPKLFESDKQGRGKKKSWHGNKKSFDLNDVQFVSEKDKPTHRKIKSLSSLDVSGIMAELSSQVHVKDVAKDVSVPVPQKEDVAVTETRLGEATRVFVQHFVDGRSAEGSKIPPSGELREALRILNSNKDMFLKLLRDPSSELVKHLEKLEDGPVQVRSGLIDQGKCKHQSFFRRTFKGLDRNSSKASADIRNEDQDERGSSRFSFTEFTRKLKLAMKKQQLHSGNVDNVGGKSLGIASPSRCHFFIEKIPKTSASKKGEQRISNMYTEAKKHLAEIVGNNDVDAELLTGEAPKSLGRIISHSDHISSPICCPENESETGYEVAVQQVEEENASDAGSANNESCITSEESQDDLEFAVDGIHTEGYTEMTSSDNGETENQISSDIFFSEPCSPSEETPKDSEEDQALDLNLGTLVINRPSSSEVCSRTEDIEDLEAITDKRPSPISVLEPFYIEDDVSPPSIKSFLVSELIQPRQIKFEDRISRAPHSRIREGVFEFVETVVQASGLTYDQLLEKALFSEHLLDPSLFGEVCFYSDHLSYDPKLIFDLVDDVLTEVCARDFDGIPSLFAQYLRVKLTMRDLVDEIRKGVDWHLQSEHTQRTLDQTVAKDFSKSWTWMDLRLDSESIGVEMEEEIFDELIEDAITSFVSWEHDEEEAPVQLDKSHIEIEI